MKPSAGGHHDFQATPATASGAPASRRAPSSRTRCAEPETKVTTSRPQSAAPSSATVAFLRGLENVSRDLAGEPQRVINISAANHRPIAAGVPASAFPNTIPTAQKLVLIARTDVELTDITDSSGGSTTSATTRRHIAAPRRLRQLLERSIDFVDVSDSVGLQLISILTPNVLNEARYQYARRYSQNLPNGNSGPSPSVIISGVANFGAPENANTIQPLETSNQLLDNVTITRGAHTIKFGGGFNSLTTRRRPASSRYTFSSIANYVAARTEPPARLYQLHESVGEPEVSYSRSSTTSRRTIGGCPRLKINYGCATILRHPQLTRTPFAFRAISASIRTTSRRASASSTRLARATGRRLSAPARASTTTRR